MDRMSDGKFWRGSKDMKMDHMKIESKRTKRFANAEQKIQTESREYCMWL